MFAVMPQISQATVCVYPGTSFWRLRSICGRATLRRPARRCDYLLKGCAGALYSPVLGWAGLGLRGELFVQTFKQGVGIVIGTQSQNPAPGVFDQAPGLEYDLLHRRLLAAALGSMAHWCVFAEERILTNQTQDVHCHSSHCAAQKVGDKLATEQALQIHVGLELRMERLLRGMVFVQINDVLCRELLGRCLPPALQFVGVQQQRIAVLIDGALDQAQYAPRRVGIGFNAFERECLRPHAHPFTFSQVTPHGVCIRHTLGSDGFDRCYAGIPLADDGDLAGQGHSVTADLLHDVEGAKPRVGTKQKRQSGQLRGHYQNPLQGEFVRQLCMGVHALAQGRVRSYCSHIKRAGKEVVTSKLLNCIEVVFALLKQAQVGLKNVAVGDAADTYRELKINDITDFQAFYILPHERQSAIGGEVAGQFFDHKVGQVLAHLQGERCMRTKSLIFMRKSTYFDF